MLSCSPKDRIITLEASQENEHVYQMPTFNKTTQWIIIFNLTVQLIILIVVVLEVGVQILFRKRLTKVWAQTFSWNQVTTLTWLATMIYLVRRSHNHNFKLNWIKLLISARLKANKVSGYHVIIVWKL